MSLDHLVEVGKDLVGYCTKCRLDLGHRVIAKVEGRVERVKCLTCGSEHNYRPRHDQPLDSPIPKTKSVASHKVKVTPKTASDLWTSWLNKSDSVDSKFYSIKEKYDVGQKIEHVSFGKGVVTQLLSNKIEVIFEEGYKILIHNRG